MLLGALEAGGTKMCCAIGDETGRILDRATFPTTTPEETMPRMLDFFKDKGILAMGIATFGPVNVVKGTKDYGHILNTPKLPWKDYDIVTPFAEALQVPVGLDTDVNGSCLGEVTYGAAKSLNCVLYLTIGTGIGAGIYANGKLLHGMLHPEAGHAMVPVSRNDPGKSVCPFHANCLEGLASGPSIEARWGKPAAELADRDEVWELEAEYIAQALLNYIYILSPQRIILGGGVMHQEQLFPKIRRKVRELNHGYVQTALLADIDHYIVPASLHDDQGLMGAIRLAELAMDETEVIKL